MDKETFKKLFTELVKSGEIKFNVTSDSDIYTGTKTITGLKVSVDGKPIAHFDLDDITFGI